MWKETVLPRLVGPMLEFARVIEWYTAHHLRSCLRENDALSTLFSDNTIGTPLGGRGWLQVWIIAKLRGDSR